MRVTPVIIALWPDLFNREAPLPLAIGIHKEIKAMLPEAPTKGISGFLSWWTARKPYLKAVIKGGPRWQLNTCKAGEVAPDEQKQAAERLERIAASVKARKKAKTKAKPAPIHTEGA